MSTVINALKSTIIENSIELIIWDFDGVIFHLDWHYETTPEELLSELFDEVNDIDDSIIKNKDEFIARMFPYPEISEVGMKHGRDIQEKVKSIFKRRETAAIHKALPNKEVIDFILQLSQPQAIWSNNLSSTITPLLEQASMMHKINYISSLDKVRLCKPEIEGFEQIKHIYPNIKNEHIILIGDSLISDKVAAENAGIKFFHYIKGK